METGVEVLQAGEESIVELARLLQVNINDDMSKMMRFANIIILTQKEKGLTIFHDEKSTVLR